MGWWVGAKTGRLRRVKRIFDELNNNGSKALEGFSRAGISCTGRLNLNDKIKPLKSETV